MPYERWATRLFRMDEDAWARHANPWSGWTRVPSLPLLFLALWSRAWIGWWCLLPLAAVLVWIWINPHLFPPPRSTRSWMSRGVLGERVWLARDRIPIPPRHRLVPHLLTAASLAGLLVAAWGVAVLAPWPAVLGTVLTMGAKLWFVDRMVWLYEDMKDADPAYRAWLR